MLHVGRFILVGSRDERATPIRYQTLYHHAFPPPPSGRGGQGQGPRLGRGRARRA